MTNGAHGAIDSKISQNNLNPNNIKNQVKSETLDAYGIIEDFMFNQGTAIFNAQTKGGDNRFYKRNFSMPSTYGFDDNEPYSTKDQIMQLLSNSIRESPDDTVSTQSVQDLYKLHKQPMPKYKKGGKVKKDDIKTMDVINMIAKLQSKSPSGTNAYSPEGKNINALIEAFNKIETPGRMKSNVDWERGDSFAPVHQRDLELKKQYMDGAVSEDIPLETGSSDMYSIFNPRHPQFEGF